MDSGLSEPNLKKEEIEAEKKKLADIRIMTAETMEKIKRLEEEHNDQKILHQKKLRNLRNAQSNYENRLTKLDSELKVLDNLSSSRREELKNLEKVNSESVAELRKTTEDTDMEICILKRRIVQLEAEVKQGYVDLQNEKEIQVLLEVGLSNVKDDDRLPLTSLESILKKRQECVKQRQEEISKEISDIEQEQIIVEAEIKRRQEKLVALKDTYLDLVHFYKKVKNS